MGPGRPRTNARYRLRQGRSDTYRLTCRRASEFESTSFGGRGTSFKESVAIRFRKRVVLSGAPDKSAIFRKRHRREWEYLRTAPSPDADAGPEAKTRRQDLTSMVVAGQTDLPGRDAPGPGQRKRRPAGHPQPFIGKLNLVEPTARPKKQRADCRPPRPNTGRTAEPVDVDGHQPSSSEEASHPASPANKAPQTQDKEQRRHTEPGCHCRSSNTGT